MNLTVDPNQPNVSAIIPMTMQDQLNMIMRLLTHEIDRTDQLQERVLQLERNKVDRSYTE